DLVERPLLEFPGSGAWIERDAVRPTIGRQRRQRAAFAIDGALEGWPGVAGQLDPRLRKIRVIVAVRVVGQEDVQRRTLHGSGARAARSFQVRTELELAVVAEDREQCQ